MLKSGELIGESFIAGDNKKYQFDFEKLEVYQLAEAYVEKIYEVTKSFPDAEKYGMTSQLRRAAISIPLNIAEGKGRFHTKVYVQFLYQARGSLWETLSLINLSLRLGYIDESQAYRVRNQIQLISAKLNGLIRSLKTKI